MRWFAIAMLSATVTHARPGVVQQSPGGGGDVEGDVAVHRNDDVPLTLGNTAAAPDAKLLWDTSGTNQLQIWLTDVDGGGTDGVPMYWLAGDITTYLGGNLDLAATRCVVTSSGTRICDGGTDGDVILTNSTGTNGVCIDNSTSSVFLYLRNPNCTGYRPVVIQQLTISSGGFVGGEGGAALYIPPTTDTSDFEFRSKKTGNRTNIKTANARVTFAANPGDASKTATALIPDGADVTGFSTRVVTTGTNCASVNIGVASDTDIFAAAAGITDNDTTDNTDITAGWSTVALDPALADTDVTVTAVGGNCFDLVIDLHVHYTDITAPTGDK